MSDVALTASQLDKLKHALGLDGLSKTGKTKRDSYRNYYNTGDTRLPELDMLVAAEIMSIRDAGKELGGFYYHVTDIGVALVKDYYGEFKMRNE